ncbi:MAG: hypothetical protein KGO05_11040 [Chloroflexota bacterium]|nr:hypothetical protein [Chloroflexota bacterium]
MPQIDHTTPATPNLLGHRVSVRIDQAGVNGAEWSAQWTALLAPWLAPERNPEAALLAAAGAEEPDSPQARTVLTVHPWVGERPFTISQQHPPGTEIPGLPDYANTTAALLRVAERLTFESAIARASFPLIVHAGAVSRNGATLVFPAVSSAGKTTLTLSLAKSGWLPLCDDICPFTEADGQFIAVGCPRCGHVSIRSELLLRGLGVELEGPVAQLSRYFRPARWGAPAPVRAIIAPRYREGAPLKIEALTQAEGAAALFGATFQRERVSRHDEWAASARLARLAPAFALTYGSLDSGMAGVDTIANAIQPPHGA